MAGRASTRSTKAAPQVATQPDSPADLMKVVNDQRAQLNDARERADKLAEELRMARAQLDALQQTTAAPALPEPRKSSLWDCLWN